MKVLVTGGAGFIGSHLADHLIEHGHSVVVVDNESTGQRENVPAAAKYFKVDVSRPDELEVAFARGVDAVCHIAGHVSLIGSFTDPVNDLRTNVQGTVNVLQLCLRYRVPRLLYASSMTAYGRNGALPTPEDTPCEPISYYGITKYAGELYVHTTAELADLVYAAFDRTRAKYQVIYKPGRPGEQRHAEADITKARTILGWQPRVTFDQGMIDTLRWAAREAIGVGVQAQ